MSSHSQHKYFSHTDVSEFFKKLTCECITDLVNLILYDGFSIIYSSPSTRKVCSNRLSLILTNVMILVYANELWDMLFAQHLYLYMKK